MVTERDDIPDVPTNKTKLLLSKQSERLTTTRDVNLAPPNPNDGCPQHQVVAAHTGGGERREKDRLAGEEVSVSATVNKHCIIKPTEFLAAHQTCWQTATILTRQLQSTEGV